MSMKPAPWAYLTNTVLVTVAFLLFLNTNMLRHSLVTTLSYLTLHYMTKLIHLNKKAYLQSSDHHINFCQAPSKQLIVDANPNRKLLKSQFIQTLKLSTSLKLLVWKYLMVGEQDSELGFYVC